ncbi:16S rRNA (guanine(966)-N(2))-methyltransferase RsmD [Georgenia subflava]|uniref:16S rRNA (Guanine(966)-N(2))-methyltransferase RsmD n=1 Tax=Georgenia subflava TaxID=1622177 RepID=A0A6N7EDZ2_9MICO|nr:16S rRNA (guanine(966)-N(2))-methyltransferase RsmD [Georgenia subflava]MPV36230.1 16S rRNA (guanine(966)-N(2))-methyltransferase RsmD [Georgenia subflava]
MTRIVAGTAGGRTLQVPRTGTRPTSERVREALFSRLEHLDVIDGARVLDLYAGSGALGLEAASRGAEHVTLVEQAKAAAALCRRNAASLGLGGVDVVTARVETYLAGAPGRHAAPAHLVLLDPPYDVAEEGLAAVLALLAARGSEDAAEPAVPGPAPWLDRAAVVVVERSRRTPEPTWPEGLAAVDRRGYGDTVVWFAEPTVS